MARFPRSQYTRDLRKKDLPVAKTVHPNRQVPRAPCPYPLIALEVIVPSHLAPLSKSLRTPGNQLHPVQPLLSPPRVRRTYEQRPGAV